MKSGDRSWLALPAVFYLGLLYLLPTLFVLGFSWLGRDFRGGVTGELSFAAWQQATDAITLRTLLRTLLLAVGVAIIDLMIAYPCAAAMVRLPRRLRRVLVFLICFPLVTSLLLRTYGWMNLLSSNWLGTISGVALVLSFNYLPFMVLPLLRAFERIDSGLHWAAADLGASPWQTFWHVTWPMTRSGVWAGIALVFIPVTGEYLVPHFIGEGQVTLLGTVIWKEFEGRNWPYAAACSAWLVGLVAMAVVLSAVRRMWSRDRGIRRTINNEAA